jgi:hypothetical protein
MRRPVLVKVDGGAECVDCAKLDEFWGMAGSALPDGTVWHARCGERQMDEHEDSEPEGMPALCRAVDWDRRRPRFEAWGGAKWHSYRGKPALENLQAWMMNVLQGGGAPTPPQRWRQVAPTMESMGFTEEPPALPRRRAEPKARSPRAFEGGVAGGEKDVNDDFYIEEEDEGDEDDDYYYEGEEEEEEEEDYRDEAYYDDKEYGYEDDEAYDDDDDYYYEGEEEEEEKEEEEEDYRDEAYYDDKEYGYEDDEAYDDEAYDDEAPHPHLSQVYTKKFFAQFRAYGDAYPALARAISAYVPKDASIVDVGCGHGFLVEALRTSGHAESYGVEGSASGAEMWPAQFKDVFYKVQDLTAKNAAHAIPETDYVSTFEVAEHLPPTHAQHFVQMLTQHRPRLVFFGAATSLQDRGRNPSHLNEQPIAYWVRRFEKEGYALDAVRSAEVRINLLSDEGYQKALQTGRAWWFVKNVVVFADVDWEVAEEAEEEEEEEEDADEGRAAMDIALANAPWEEPPPAATKAKAPAGTAAAALLAAHFAAAKRRGGESGHVLGKLWTSMYDRNKELGPIWRRDWDEFAELFAGERRKALVRLRQGSEL